MNWYRCWLVGLLLSCAFLIHQPLFGQLPAERKVIDPKQIKFDIDVAALVKPDVKWQVYTLAAPQVTAAGFQSQLGQFLGQDASRGKVNTVDDRLVYVGPTDASVYCSQDKATGNLSLKKSLGAYLGEKTPQLPDAGAAEKMALESLQKYKLAPKNNNEIKMIHSGGLRMTSVKEGKGGSIIDKLRTITFGRRLDEIPVQGSGSKIVVRIGDRGDIVALTRRWREVARARPVKAEELKDPRQVDEELRRLLATEWSEAREIVVRQGALVYYDGDGKFIQPAYMFETTVVEGENKYPYITALPALKQPPESIGPAKMPPEARSLLKEPKPGTE
jgi:hypothetical protein